MIKYCNECTYFKYSVDTKESRCYNPTVNKADYWMLASESGKSYGSYTKEQRRGYSWPWSSNCGIQGKHFKLNIEAFKASSS
jgi:hypothetical protein